jgi:flagellum-specific ATP synthase
MKELLATYKDAEDLVNIGAYKPGSNPKIDKALKYIDQINDFLRQNVDDPTSYQTTLQMMQQILVNAR